MKIQCTKHIAIEINTNNLITNQQTNSPAEMASDGHPEVDNRRLIEEIVSRWKARHQKPQPAEQSTCYGERRMRDAMTVSQMDLEACSKNDDGSRLVDCFIPKVEFKDADTAREQVYVGVNDLIAVHRLDLAAACKEMGRLMKYRSFIAIRRLYDNHRAHLLLSSESRLMKSLSAPGRPRLISYEQTVEIVAFVASMFVQHRVLTFDMLCCFIENDLQIDATRETIRNALCADEVFRTVEVKPMEEGRFGLSPAAVEKHFVDLGIAINNVPAPFIVNADETGFQEWCDFKNMHSCVPAEFTEKSLDYPLKRCGARSTALIGISLSETLLLPLVIVKRSTLDMELIENGYGDKAVYAHSPSGYITSDLYSQWFSESLVPYIQKERARSGYAGKSVLIVDGCSAHQSEKVDILALDNKIKILTLPSHSSHILQPLDLGIFGVQKGAFARLKIKTEHLSEQTTQIIKILASLQRAASPLFIVRSFRAAGIIPVVKEQGGSQVVCACISVREGVKAKKILDKWREMGGDRTQPIIIEQERGERQQTLSEIIATQANQEAQLSQSLAAEAARQRYPIPLPRSSNATEEQRDLMDDDEIEEGEQQTNSAQPVAKASKRTGKRKAKQK